MIIKDFTDNDLYKFTTMNAIQKKFPDAEVVYRFVNRGETDFPSGFAEALQAEVEEMRGLTRPNGLCGENVIISILYFSIS